MVKMSTELLNRAIRVAIDGINPRSLINSFLHLEKRANDDFLLISDQSEHHQFKINKNVFVCAFGKASLGMSTQLEALFKDAGMSGHIIDALAILPHSQVAGSTDWSIVNNNQVKSSKFNSMFKFYYGAENNLPDRNSVHATHQAIQMIESIQHHDIDSALFLCLISGGGSALLTQPNQIISDSMERNLDLKVETIKRLVESGATINELNTVRSCLSQVKGGNLARLIKSSCHPKPVTILSLIISDVINDPLDIIASGPTYLGSSDSLSTRSKQSLQILHDRRIVDLVPSSVISYLTSKSEELSNSKVDSEPYVFNYLIGNNKLATSSMAREMKTEFDVCHVITNGLEGEAKLVGVCYACLVFMLLTGNQPHSEVIKSIGIIDDLEAIGSMLESFKTTAVTLTGQKRVCVLSGGETTVTFNKTQSQSGLGGRNQELTLAFELTFATLVQHIESTVKFEVAFSSFGTDGIDGPTDAAGATFVYNSRPDQLISKLEMLDYLNRHDSYNYYSKHGRLLKTGPTGSNVSDVQCLLLNIE